MITVTRDIPAVSFSGNPMVIRVNTTNHLDGATPRPNYTLFLYLYDENPSGSPDPIFTDSIQVDHDGNGYFDISSVINPNLYPSIPWPQNPENLVVTDATAVFGFWLTICEGFGDDFTIYPASITSAKKYAIPGGLSDDLLTEIDNNESNQFAFITANKLFLTNQPRTKKCYPSQPEFLRWLHGSGTSYGNKLVKKEFNFNTGATTISTLATFDLTPYTLLNIDVSPGSSFTLNQNTDKWEIYLTTAVNTVISEIMTYELPDLVTKNQRSFIFQNSMGGFDSVFATGDFHSKLEAQGNIAFKPIKTNIRNTLLPTQDRPRAKNIFYGSIGYFNSDELSWLSDLFFSEKRFLVQENKLSSIVLRRDEQPSSSDLSAMKIDIEAILGVADFFFHG